MSTSVGVREFRWGLAEFSDQTDPTTVTRRGKTVGLLIFIPVGRGREAHIAAGDEAARKANALLTKRGVAEDEVVAEFATLRREDAATPLPSPALARIGCRDPMDQPWLPRLRKPARCATHYLACERCWLRTNCLTHAFLGRGQGEKTGSLPTQTCLLRRPPPLGCSRKRNWPRSCRTLLGCPPT